MDGDEHVEQSDFSADRRAFFKRMAVLAFAAPVISSFALDSAAFAGGPNEHDRNQKGYPGSPNQYGQNQTVHVPPNQYGGNQTVHVPPNQYGGNQTVHVPPNQYGQNQTKEPCGPDGRNGKNQGKKNKSGGTVQD